MKPKDDWSSALCEPAVLTLEMIEQAMQHTINAFGRYPCFSEGHLVNSNDWKRGYGMCLRCGHPFLDEKIFDKK